MNFAKIALLVMLSVAVADLTGTAQPRPNIKAKVIAVKDGDTIEILYNGKPLSVRLAHIDCPELRRGQAFGKAAKQFTSLMCFGQMVNIENNNKFDRYHRLIGIVVNERGQNLNKELLIAGLAWHFKKYSADQTYAVLEDDARARHVGLWSDKHAVAPWEWRHR